MKYNLEQLGDERFQQLVQALLAVQFPKVQCLPVGQADGGRDAFVLQHMAQSEDSAIIFQVKFSNSPQQKSERQSVEQLIKSEQEKIRELIKQGAEEYYFITNVGGTSKLDTGSIDSINRLLSKSFGIPCYCWWRDDVERRLDSNADIKWSFPEILRGTDVLQQIVDGIWSSRMADRERALRSYIAAQCKEDEEVKFKQVELQNNILELFVDMPISSAGTKYSRYYYIDEGALLIHDHDEDDVEVTEGAFYAHRSGGNAAGLLLEGPYFPEMSNLVIEGAPGQGKSTITQYVCQVHRLKILDKEEDIIKIAPEHQRARVRVPFRIDLRDYASWIAGRNPFSQDASDRNTDSISLETFIAAQIAYLSGGQDFQTADLVAIVRNSDVTIVLDGFDEVADIATRKQIVFEISNASTRLRAHQRGIQIVVTSRPAAFANSPGFSKDDWVHLELQAMTRTQINVYSRKWMEARRLLQREKSEFTALLKEKLVQPHMRELARNPMQLTILLALIHTRGLSLPDKRTALYDNYMELFFNRESEKSRVVREYRDILIDIHRYVAWVLHTEAEEKNTGGIIDENDLRGMLKEYLISEGHSVGIMDELFVGMVERVVALVSRVQGTFEFEVQPLREYFAARHLYETAPYSPPGDEKAGTKPERFDALARNFYWLNVTRFYCGCFSRGELSALADGVEALASDEQYRYLAHPRTVALMLLGDWVFSQQPLLVARVVSNVFEQPGRKILLACGGAEGGASMALPERCGRDELARIAYSELEVSTVAGDRASLLRLIRQNTDIKSRTDRWLFQETSQEIEQWLADGLTLGIINHLTTEQLRKIAAKCVDEAFGVLFAALRFDVIESDAKLMELATKRIVNGATYPIQFMLQKGKKNTSYVALFVTLCSTELYRMFISQSENAVYARQSFLHRSGLGMDTDSMTISECVPPEVSSFVSSMSQLVHDTSVKWSASTMPWTMVVTSLTREFGFCWSAAKLSVLAAGIRSRSEPGSWPERGWADEGRMVEAVRFARLKSGNPKWWRLQLQDLPQEVEHRRVAILTLLRWGTAKTILSIEPKLSLVVDAFEASDWEAVHRALAEVSIDSKRETVTVGDIDSVSLRLVAALSLRFRISYSAEKLLRRAILEEPQEPVVVAFLASRVQESGLTDARKANEYLECLSNRNWGRYYHFAELSSENMSDQIAKEICARAVEFPEQLVRVAQNRLAAATGSSAVKLGAVARKEHWF